MVSDSSKKKIEQVIELAPITKPIDQSTYGYKSFKRMKYPPQVIREVCVIGLELQCKESKSITTVYKAMI